MQPIPIRQIKDAPVESRAAGQFSIRDLSGLLKGNDLSHALHRHNFFFVLALDKGKGVHEIDFVTHEINDRSVFILRPGQVHSLELNAASTGFIMEFDAEFYRPASTQTAERLKKAIAKNHCRFDSNGFNRLLALLQNIYTEFSDKPGDYTEATKAYLDLFFIEFIRQGQHPGQASQSTGNYTQDKFEELTGLLEANIITLKNVSQYAALMNLSAYQLNAITKATVGKTVSDLINEQIILEAKRYLLATSSQVKDIAYYLGYEDISYFIRFFKKQTGLTPEVFRQNFK